MVLSSAENTRETINKMLWVKQSSRCRCKIATRHWRYHILVVNFATSRQFESGWQLLLLVMCYVIHLLRAVCRNFYHMRLVVVTYRRLLMFGIFSPTRQSTNNVFGKTCDRRNVTIFFHYVPVNVNTLYYLLL